MIERTAVSERSSEQTYRAVTSNRVRRRDHGDAFAGPRQLPNRAVGRWVQRNLTIGAANDPLEREADQVADQIVSRFGLARIGPQAVSSHNLPAATSAEPASADIQAGISRARGRGRPLPPSLKTDMEDAFDVDFAHVRIHTGSTATDLNQQLSARAFTTGADIFLSDDTADLSSAAGRRLLAHELTHVVQQSARRESVRRTIHRCAACGNPGAVRNTGRYWPLSETRRGNGNALARGVSAKVGGSIQRGFDKELAENIKGFGDYQQEREFMSWKGGRQLAHVGWKAHVGVEKKDRLNVVHATAGALVDFGVNHKYLSTDDSVLPKFVTIYEPDDENLWKPVIERVESAVRGIATVTEPSTEPVGEEGSVAMRHGQLTGLSQKKLLAEDVGATTKSAPRGLEKWSALQPIYYDVDPAKVIRDDGQHLAFVPKMGAMFFLAATGPPIAAIILDGNVAQDPRTDWNPNDVDLPPGVFTNEDLRTADDIEVGSPRRGKSPIRQALERREVL